MRQGYDYRMRASIQRGQLSPKTGEEWTRAQDNRDVRVSAMVVEKRGDYRVSSGQTEGYQSPD